jgi:hypothetical protein
MSISAIGSFLVGAYATDGVSKSLTASIASKADAVPQKPLVNVDPKMFLGTWSGNWGKEGAFSVQVLQVQKYSAQVIYRNGSTLQSSTVLIRDNTIKIGNMKIKMVGTDAAAAAMIVTDPASGTQTTVQTQASRKA